MGAACEKVQSQQKDIEEMKKAIDQLKEIMEDYYFDNNIDFFYQITQQTKGAQESLKNGLQEITKTTTEVVDKYKTIITKVDGFEQNIKQLEENIKKTIENSAKQGVQGAMKSFF